MKTVLVVLIAVNALWAAAFFGYIQRSTTPVIAPSRDLSAAVATNANAPVASAPAVIVVPGTNSMLAAELKTNPAPRSPKSLASNDKQFGWQDITNESYLDYIARLRSVGCPEKQVRNIVVSDVNELFDKRRLEHAIKTDSQWWRAETFMGILPMQNFAGANFDDERRALLTKLLGENWEDSIRLPSLNRSAVNLTGPVLGALPPDLWNSVQEICARSMDRHQAHINAKMNEGGALDNVEMARLRDLTRQDLAKILTPEQLEEFLLRYSHNSSKLRQDMRGLDLLPDEFRKIFRAIDPMEHQTQMDYGGPEALSQKQREQLDAQRDRAIREALSPQRYTQYLATKDPLYKQAQLTAMQYGMNGKAVHPLYQMQKNMEAKRNEISQNASLTPEQRSQALQSLGVEQQQTLQRMLTDGNYRQ
ncbi:MAG TPA: hypothetical protein VNT99_08935 [Methylomirabilota bacterium]|nr:hypothetical protein [Methylomirabilota bacterium]